MTLGHALPQLDSSSLPFSAWNKQSSFLGIFPYAVSLRYLPACQNLSPDYSFPTLSLFMSPVQSDARFACLFYTGSEAPVFCQLSLCTFPSSTPNWCSVHWPLSHHPQLSPLLPATDPTSLLHDIFLCLCLLLGTWFSACNVLT